MGIRGTLPLRLTLALQRGVFHFQKLKGRNAAGPGKPVGTFAKYLPYIERKRGLEIGGPTEIFRSGNILPIYGYIEQLDNCDFSDSNAWAKHTRDFVFNPAKMPGKTLFRDGSALSDVPESTYEVLLSSHNLEHFANPVKALMEWRRVLKSDGALVLVLPYYRATFDHRRQPTPVDHMFEDFAKQVGEDDLTHLPEILKRHDLAKDVGAGTFEQFYQRSVDNLTNRCLHHHVFDEHNSRALLARSGYEVLALEFRLPSHMCILARVIPL